MRMYVISTTGPALFAIPPQPGLLQRRRVTPEDLTRVFNSLPNGGLIACTNMEHAQRIAGCLYSTAEQHDLDVENNVRFSHSPVIYTVDVDERNLPNTSQLQVGDLVGYCTNSPEENVINTRFQVLIENPHIEIEIRKINLDSITRVIRATHFNAGPEVTSTRLNITRPRHREPINTQTTEPETLSQENQQPDTRAQAMGALVAVAGLGALGFVLYTGGMGLGILGRTVLGAAGTAGVAVAAEATAATASRFFSRRNTDNSTPPDSNNNPTP